MPDLGNSRHKLKIALGAMLAADVIAAAILFSPLVGSEQSRTEQLNQMRIELLKKNRDVTPLRGMDKKIGVAKQQIGEFYKERFAASDSELLRELGQLATENKIPMQHMSYKEEAPETSGVIPLEIGGTFTGDYLQLVRFINTLERSKLFIAVDSVDLAGETAGSMRLQITMHS